MKLFHLKPDDVNWGPLYKYEINATHKWGLPGVKCSVCNTTWAMTGVDYPAVNLSFLPSADRYRDRWPVSVDVLNELRRPIIPLLTPNAILPPGTELGPLVGKAWGKFGDFAWLNPWTMLMQRATYQKLISTGVRMPVEGMTPELKFRSKSFPDLVEPQIEPLVSLKPTSFLPPDSPPCPACGHNSHKLEHMIADVATMPSSVDLFRSREHPTFILATEKFGKAVKELRLTDILFDEIEISN